MITRVKQMADAREISQATLAREIGISPGLMSLKIRGLRPFKISELNKLASILSASVGYLIYSERENDRAIPVSYVGIQKWRQRILVLVNEPNGSTIVYNQDLHKWNTPADELKFRTDIEKHESRIYAKK